MQSDGENTFIAGAIDKSVEAVEFQLGIRQEPGLSQAAFRFLTVNRAATSSRLPINAACTAPSIESEAARASAAATIAQSAIDIFKMCCCRFIILMTGFVMSRTGLRSGSIRADARAGKAAGASDGHTSPVNDQDNCGG